MRASKNVKKNSKRSGVKRGRGLLNTLIDKLPMEVHLPGYQYCGPGTKLDERLARGDKGVNKLDGFCKNDIAYATHKNSKERYVADKKLGAEAFRRVFSKDASMGERAASLLVSAAMKAKTGLSKIGGGIKKFNCTKKPKKSKKSKKIAFSTLVKDVKNTIKKSKARAPIDSVIQAAIVSAKKSASVDK